MTYSEKLKHPKWQKKRLEILQRDNFECQICNDKETTLHVHHLKYTKNPWDAPNEDLITYCEDCHLIIETIEYSKEVKILKIHKTSNKKYRVYFIRGYIRQIIFCEIIDGKIEWLVCLEDFKITEIYEAFKAL